MHYWMQLFVRSVNSTSHLTSIVLMACLLFSNSSFAVEQPQELNGVGIVEKLGTQIPLNEFHFRNENGEVVALSSFFEKHKPVIFVFSYYKCPHLCSLVINGLVAGMKGLQWKVGSDFTVVTLSIDPKEGPDLATEKKASYIKNYGRLGVEKGWHFLTGEENQIKKLADTMGFQYKYDAPSKDYLHSAGIFLVTPKGVLSRILYGVQFSSKNLRLGLLEASDGKVGTVVDRILYYCYRYDPESRGYTVYAVNLMKAGGASTVLIFGGYLILFWRSERRRKKNET